MSNPNRKFKTLTRQVEEAEERMCLRCVPQTLTPLTLKDAQKKPCKCAEHCGYEFCNGLSPATPMPSEIEEELFIDGPLGPITCPHCWAATLPDEEHCGWCGEWIAP